MSSVSNSTRSRVTRSQSRAASEQALSSTGSDRAAWKGTKNYGVKPRGAAEQAEEDARTQATASQIDAGVDSGVAVGAPMPTLGEEDEDAGSVNSGAAHGSVSYRIENRRGILLTEIKSFRDPNSPEHKGVVDWRDSAQPVAVQSRRSVVLPRRQLKWKDHILDWIEWTAFHVRPAIVNWWPFVRMLLLLSSAVLIVWLLQDRKSAMDFYGQPSNSSIAGMQAKINTIAYQSHSGYLGHNKRIEQHDNRLTKVEKELAAQKILIDKLTAAPVRKIDYFDYRQGARVDPYLTSPRYSPTPLASQNTRPIINKLFSIFGVTITEHPYDHTEFVDEYPNIDAKSRSRINLPRFCAPSTRGKLQYTKIMPRAIIPTELVLSYHPKDEMMLMGAAPKEVQLWIEVKNRTAIAAIAHHVQILHPSILRNKPSKQGLTLDDKQALGRDWIPVGQWKYDINSPHFTQTFRIGIDLAEFDIKVTKAAMRVNSNWGAQDVTCFCQAALHGVDVSGIKEPLERLWD